MPTANWRPSSTSSSTASNATAYSGYMKATTVKMSVETRDRIRALGGETYEDTIVEALDVLEADRVTIT
jgi:hypothetical protein